MPDDLAATLTGIRERSAIRAKIAPGFGAERTDFKLLLAAVDAVLKLHRPVWNDYADGDGIERSSRDCAECEPPGTPDNWPCPTVRAIRAALGEETGDA